MSSPKSGPPIQLRQGLNQLALLLSLERNRLCSAEYRRLLLLLIEVRLKGEALVLAEALMDWNEHVSRESRRLRLGVERGDPGGEIGRHLEEMFLELGAIEREAATGGAEEGRVLPRELALLGGLEGASPGRRVKAG